MVHNDNSVSIGSLTPALDSCSSQDSFIQTSLHNATPQSFPPAPPLLHVQSPAQLKVPLFLDLTAHYLSGISHASNSMSNSVHHMNTRLKFVQFLEKIIVLILQFPSLLFLLYLLMFILLVMLLLLSLVLSVVLTCLLWIEILCLLDILLC